MFTIFKLVDRDTNTSSFIISANQFNDSTSFSFPTATTWLNNNSVTTDDPVENEPNSTTASVSPSTTRYNENSTIDDILDAIVNSAPQDRQSDVAHFGSDTEKELQNIAEGVMMILICLITIENILAVTILAYGIARQRRLRRLRSWLVKPAILLPGSGRDRGLTTLRKACLAEPARMNYDSYPYLLSLAASDLLIGVLVAPMQLHLYRNKGVWLLGSRMCDFWRAMDVFFCTSSALHTAAIAADRFWTATRSRRLASSRITEFQKTLLGFLWVLSAMVSFPVTYIWQIESPERLLGSAMESRSCEPISDATFNVLSTTISFGMPLAVTLVFYVQTIIFFQSQIAMLKRQTTVCLTALLTNVLVQRDTEAISRHTTINPVKIPLAVYGKTADASVASAVSNAVAALPSTDVSQGRFDKKHVIRAINNLSSVRLSRSLVKAMTVVVIFYTMCWTPFFSTMLVNAYCACLGHELQHTLINCFIWLGYANSAFNPIIYYCTLREYRSLSRHLLRDLTSKLWVSDWIFELRDRIFGIKRPDVNKPMASLMAYSTREVARLYHRSSAISKQEQSPIRPKRSNSFINAMSVLQDGSDQLCDLNSKCYDGNQLVVHSVGGETKHQLVPTRKQVVLSDISDSSESTSSSQQKGSYICEDSTAPLESTASTDTDSTDSTASINSSSDRILSSAVFRPSMSFASRHALPFYQPWRRPILFRACSSEFRFPYYDEWHRPINAKSTEFTI